MRSADALAPPAAARPGSSTAAEAACRCRAGPGADSAHPEGAAALDDGGEEEAFPTWWDPVKPNWREGR